MTAPDPLKVRGYRLESDSHRKNATNALARLKSEINHLRVDSSSLRDAQNAATTLTELIVALSALKAAEELRFLAEEA
jgi:hypothetical protein